eukprot:6912862-Heterocapsa_arctica.AAC.1
MPAPALDALILRLGIVGMEAGVGVAVRVFVNGRRGVLEPKQLDRRLRGPPPFVDKEAALADAGQD